MRLPIEKAPDIVPRLPTRAEVSAAATCRSGRCEPQTSKLEVRSQPGQFCHRRALRLAALPSIDEELWAFLVQETEGLLVGGGDS